MYQDGTWRRLRGKGIHPQCVDRMGLGRGKVGDGKVGSLVGRVVLS
jgi:hypothetical protein